MYFFAKILKLHPRGRFHSRSVRMHGNRYLFTNWCFMTRFPVNELGCRWTFQYFAISKGEIKWTLGKLIPRQTRIVLINQTNGNLASRILFFYYTGQWLIPHSILVSFFAISKGYLGLIGYTRMFWGLGSFWSSPSGPKFWLRYQLGINLRLNFDYYCLKMGLKSLADRFCN